MKSYLTNHRKRDYKTILNLLCCFFAIILFIRCSSPKPDGEANSQAILLSNQQDTTEYYTYNILYHDSIESRQMADSLKQFAERSKNSFMEKLPEDTSYFHVTPWELRIDFKKAFESQKLLSFTAETYEFTGGAHGMPAIHSFNIDKTNSKFIHFQDLFSDTTAALQAISRYAINQIASKIYQKKSVGDLEASNSQWIKEGAAPLTKNYATFLPSQPKNNTATGIEIIFSAYQVAPYAAGMPRIFIPDSVFHKLLQPDYKPAFK